MAAFLYHRVDLIAQHRGYLALGLDINRKLGAGHPLATHQLHGRYLHDVVMENVKPRGLGIKDNERDRKSTRLNSSHANISYAVFCLKKKKSTQYPRSRVLPIPDLYLS